MLNRKQQAKTRRWHSDEQKNPLFKRAKYGLVCDCDVIVLSLYEEYHVSLNNFISIAYADEIFNFTICRGAFHMLFFHPTPLFYLHLTFDVAELKRSGTIP